MEVYILDELFRRVKVVDSHSSMIWSERMTDLGDMEIDIFSTDSAKRLFPSGTWLAMSHSYRMMQVETIEDSTTDSGIATLKIKGRSMEKILADRLALGDLTDTTTMPKWVITDQPADIARKIFHDICVTGTIDAGDIIPFVTEGTFLPTSLIPEPTDTVTYEIEPQSVYSSLKTLCDLYLMGFRFIRKDNGEAAADIYFEIFMGNDRTTGQTTFPAVVFSESLDNLQNTSELSSIALEKNVAYVVSPVGAEVVYAPDVDPAVAGFERKVLLVNATDITDPDGPTATALMIQRGLTELSKYRKVSAFDGEMSQTSRYIPNVDFFQGDLVEQRSKTGARNTMQVTELIHISDINGDRHYPTLSLYQFITAGSWDSQPADLVWDAVNPVTTWDGYS
jgi:hypothetical protein